jgi:hypothetical protein
MAVPQAISGNLGKVTVGGSTVAEISKFKATLDRGGKTYGAQSGVSAGIGWEKTLNGTHKCSGTFEGFFDPNFPIGSICDVDALVTLTLYSNFPGSYITGAARIFSRDFSADIDTGDPEPFNYAFQYHGPPTLVGM